MTDRDERSDRLRKRFDRGADDEDTESDTSETADASEDVETPDESVDDTTPDDDSAAAEGAESESGSESTASAASEELASKSPLLDAADDDTAVKDRKSVMMYLPEVTERELDARFDELNARYKRKYGEPLEKNRHYYPAVVTAGLTDADLENLLGL